MLLTEPLHRLLHLLLPMESNLSDKIQLITLFLIKLWPITRSFTNCSAHVGLQRLYAGCSSCCEVAEYLHCITRTALIGVHVKVTWELNSSIWLLQCLCCESSQNARPPSHRLWAVGVWVPARSRWWRGRLRYPVASQSRPHCVTISWIPTWASMRVYHCSDIEPVNTARPWKKRELETNVLFFLREVRCGSWQIFTRTHFHGFSLWFICLSWYWVIRLFLCWSEFPWCTWFSLWEKKDALRWSSQSLDISIKHHTLQLMIIFFLLYNSIFTGGPGWPWTPFGPLSPWTPFSPCKDTQAVEPARRNHFQMVTQILKMADWSPSFPAGPV